QVVGGAFAERGVDLTVDERVPVQRVAELVIDGVRHATGVAAERAAAEEVDAGAVGQRVAELIDIDGGDHRVGQPGEVRVDAARVVLHPVQVDEGGELRVGQLVVGRAPGDGSTRGHLQSCRVRRAGVVEDGGEGAVHRCGE